ncbi:MAG: glycosyltransferase [Bacteroidales bacterium]|nr:glycosyltransferase [Bacteroidales bacterium]
MKRAIVCVTNDLVTDQRVHKTCNALIKSGFEVTVVGRKLPESLPLHREYQTKRFRLLFNKSALFYAEYSLRLFLYLLFHPASLLFANDLDTLAAAWMAKKIKNCALIYDSHEFFTHTPELIHRKKIQKIWLCIEKFIFPKISDVITVNESIAALYKEKYGNTLHVVRNIPPEIPLTSPRSRQELGIPTEKKMILLQGAGINIHRGAEEAVIAMKEVDNAVLYIIGSGDVFPLLPALIHDHQLEGKVILLPRQTPEMLRNYTRLADLGLSIDKDTNLNYHFSLPNKLFDYIHSGVPVIASRLPEIERIITTYDIGAFIPGHQPAQIAQTLNEALADEVQYKRWKKNLKHAVQELRWEEEEKILLAIFERYG